MTKRKTPLLPGHYYHTFNRGINHQSIFLGDKDYHRALATLSYYRYAHPPLSFSRFLLQSTKKQQLLHSELVRTEKLIEIIAYCLMPNHFHLVLRQIKDNGISTYLANFQNSYTKAFTARHKRDSAILNRSFRSVPIHTEEQLLHLTRYVHLNPYSANFIPKEQIASYPWSSMREYISGNYVLCNPTPILHSTPHQYLNFVMDHADYQRNGELIKHLALE